MRLFSFILSIYILVLTGVPCCAYDHCEDESATIENTSTAPAQDHKTDSKKSCSTCSPFFCHTCSGFIVSVLSFKATPVFFTSSADYNTYHSPFRSQYIYSYWQPPDIA